MASRTQFHKHHLHAPMGAPDAIIFPAAFLLVTLGTAILCVLIHWS